MKSVKYSLNIIFISILFFSLNSFSLAAGKVTLLIHPTLYKAMGGPEGVVADLKKEKGIDVTVITSPYGNILDKAVLSFVSGGGEFDVVTWVGPWINSETVNFLEPLENNISSAPVSYDYNDIIGSLRKVAMYPKANGKTYGLPYRVGTGIFYYRKDLFQKANLKVPTTWDEFLNVSEKLYQPDSVFGVVQRGKPGVHVEQDFKRYLFSTGHAVLSDDYKTCLLDQNDSIRVLEVFGKPFLSGWAPPDMLAWGRDEYRTAMMQGRAAMGLYFSPYWGLMTNPEKSKVADQLGWFLVPNFSGKNQGATLNGGWFAVMDKNSKNKKDAFELMMAMTNKKNQLRGGLEWSNGPVRSSVYNDAGFNKKFPVAKAWLNAISLGLSDAQHPRIAQISDITSKEIINYLQKKKSAKQAMGDACNQIKPLL